MRLVQDQDCSHYRYQMAGLSKAGLIFTPFHKNWEMHPLNNLEMQTQSSDAYLVPLKPSTMENLTSVGGHLEIFKTCLNCLNSLIRSKHCKSHELNFKSGDSVYLTSVAVQRCLSRKIVSFI